MKRILILSFSCLAACVTNPQPPESNEEACERICEREGECPGLEGGEACIKSCIASHYPASCADAIVDSKCSELTAGVQGGAVWVGACYPKCSPDGVACQKDVLVACTLGRYEQQDCSFRCEAKGETYNGVCSKTHNGQTLAFPDCWCD